MAKVVTVTKEPEKEPRDEEREPVIPGTEPEITLEPEAAKQKDLEEHKGANFLDHPKGSVTIQHFERKIREPLELMRLKDDQVHFTEDVMTEKDLEATLDLRVGQDADITRHLTFGGLFNDYKLIDTDEWPYTIGDTDTNTFFLCSSGNANVVLNLPTASDNDGRILGFLKFGEAIGDYTITLTPDGTDTIELNNGSWSSYQLRFPKQTIILIAYNGDWIRLDNASWYLRRSPGTGWHTLHSSWGGVNNFSAYGKYVTFSNEPDGLLAVKCNVYVEGASARAYWRMEDDPTISNTPNTAPTELAMVFPGALQQDRDIQATFFVGTNKRFKITVTNTSTNIYVTHPFAILI